MFRKFIREQQGMEMVEWSLVAVLFAIVAGAAYTTVSGGVTGAIGRVVATLN